MIVNPVRALRPRLFEEDADISPAPWDLLNRVDLDQFEPLRDRDRHPEDYPTAWRGLTRWTLRPKAVENIAGLHALALHAISRCCKGDAIVIKETIKRDMLKYRFVIVAGGHAHTGVLVFTGQAVAKVLAGDRPQ